jgi:hypothetical protein
MKQCGPKKKTSSSLSIVMKIETATQIYIKDSNIKCYGNLSTWVVTCRQTNGDEVNSCILQHLIVNAPKKDTDSHFSQSL